jgi:agmatinase
MDRSLSPIILMGLPFDENSSFLRGAANGPAALREALYSPATSLWTENGIDLGDGRIEDRGDLELDRAADPFAAIAGKSAELAAAGRRVVWLGGDHSVTYPIFEGLSKSRLATIVHFDAHPDLYDALDGNRLSHACPFARIMEKGLAGRLVQVGLRNVSGHQRDQARRFGVETIEMKDLGSKTIPDLNGPVYLSFDMDVLDPAFAPGASHHEPGGLTTREALGMIRNLSGDLMGADVVELNPSRDYSGITAAAAAKIVKEIAGRMLEDG